MILLKNLLVGIYISCLFSIVRAEEIQNIETSPSILNRHHSSINLIYFGIASPVGFYGITGDTSISSQVDISLGIGHGTYGDHVTLNLKDNFEKQSNWNRYFYYGTSYSAGQKSRPTSDGGWTNQLGDALWVNGGFGFKSQSIYGFNYGYEIGLTATIATEWKRNNEKAEIQSQHICDMMALCTPKSTKRGIIVPAITPLKISYEF